MDSEPIETGNHFDLEFCYYCVGCTSYSRLIGFDSAQATHDVSVVVGVAVFAIAVI